MIMLVIGALFIGVAALLDSFFRLRMQRIGEKWALLQGGAFDYYVMWAAATCGIALLIAGFFSYFGTSPLR